MVRKHHPKGSHNPSQKSLQRWDNEGGAPKGGRLERPQLAAKKSEQKMFCSDVTVAKALRFFGCEGEHAFGFKGEWEVD